MGLVSITLCEPLLWGWWSRMHNHAFVPAPAIADATCTFLQRTKLQDQATSLHPRTIAGSDVYIRVELISVVTAARIGKPASFTRFAR